LGGGERGGGGRAEVVASSYSRNYVIPLTKKLDQPLLHSGFLSRKTDRNEVKERRMAKFKKLEVALTRLLFVFPASSHLIIFLSSPQPPFDYTCKTT